VSGDHFPTAWLKVHLRLEPVGQPDPDRLIRLEGVPSKLAVTKNDWNTADTFTAELDLEDFPFDPAIVRGATVEAFIADAGSLDPGFWPRQTLDQMRSHAVILGVVDKIENVFDEEARKVKLSGRDYTAYFLDAEMLPGPISFMEGTRKLTFVEVIERIIAEHPNAKDLKVVADPDVLAICPADYKARGEDPETGSRKRREGEVIWEALQEIALEAGCIVYVELDQVRIRLPETIFVDQSLDESLFWRWILGKNVTSFSMRRLMGRQHGIRVLVSSYDVDGKRTLSAFWPENPLEATKAEISAAPLLDEEKRETSSRQGDATPFAVRNIKSQTQLTAIAKSLFELLRHHETEGEIETDDMVDSRGRSVVEIGFGDPVIFDVSEGLASIVTLDRSGQIQALIEKGYDRITAQDVATALNAQRVPFYFKMIEHRWGSDDGEGYTFRAEIRARRQVGVDAPPTEKALTLTLGG